MDDSLNRASITFDCGRPEDHRYPVPHDVRFQLDCGIRPDDLRDELLVLDR
jgi:hypothetical protein